MHISNRTQVFRQAFLAAVLVCIGSIRGLHAQEVYVKKDNFSGITQFFTEKREADLEGGSFFSGRYADFSLDAFSDADPTKRFSIQITTFTGSWLFIRAGASLELKLDDGPIVPVVGPGSLGLRVVISGDLVNEIALYPVGDDLISQLASAKRVEFRVYGDNGIITGTIPKKFSADAAGMLARVPLPSGASPSGQSPPPRLGVHYVPLDRAAIQAIHPSFDHGLIVINVDAGSLAAKVGLQRADIMVAIDGQPLAAITDLQKALNAMPSGTHTNLHVWRGGTELDVPIDLP